MPVYSDYRYSKNVHRMLGRGSTWAKGLHFGASPQHSKVQQSIFFCIDMTYFFVWKTISLTNTRSIGGINEGVKFDAGPIQSCFKFAEIFAHSFVRFQFCVQRQIFQNYYYYYFWGVQGPRYIVQASCYLMTWSLNVEMVCF